jgi:hypothetical protein
MFRTTVVVKRIVWCGSSVMCRKPIKNAGRNVDHRRALYFTAVICSSPSAVLFMSSSNHKFEASFIPRSYTRNDRRRRRSGGGGGGRGRDSLALSPIIKKTSHKY